MNLTVLFQPPLDASIMSKTVSKPMWTVESLKLAATDVPMAKPALLTLSVIAGGAQVACAVSVK